MCRYQPSEEDSPFSEDYAGTDENGQEVDPRLEMRLRMLDARISRVEMKMARLEEKMRRLQRGIRAVCAMFLVTLVYAIYK